MALQDNNLMLLDLSDGFPRTIDNANDTLRVGVDSTFAADLAVGGNLTVTGDIISGGTMDVVVTDNFIDLSNGQGTGANKSGGLTVNVQSSVARVNAQNAVFQDAASSGSGFATISIPGFDPSTGGVGGASLADGDIIEIAGMADLAGNNGLFVVETIAAGAAGLISIKNSSQTQSPWAQTNFESGTETAASASFAPAVDLGVFCISDGALLDIGGNTIPVGQFVSAFDNAAKLSTLAYEAAANVSLQEAYNVGGEVGLLDTVSGGQGDMIIKTDDTGARAEFLLQNAAKSHSYLATSAGSVQVGDGATIKVNVSGQVSSDIIFDGVAGRTISQAGQDLTLSTSGAGADISIASGAAQVNIDSADESRFAMAANDANAKTLSVIAQNGGGGAGNLTLQADNTIQANGADVSVGASAKIDLNAQSALADALVLQAPNGGMDLTSAGDMDLTSVTGAVNVTAQGGAVLVRSNNSDLVVDAVGAKVDIDGGTGVTMSAAAGGFQIDGAGLASSVESNGVDLTVRTVTGGNLILDGAGNVSSTAATNWGATATGGDLQLAAGGAASMLATTGATVQGGGQVVLRSTATDLDIDAQTSIAMDSVGATAITGGSTLTASSGGGNAIFQATGGVARLASTNQGAEVIGSSTALIQAGGGNLTISHQDAGSRLLISTQGTGSGAGAEALSISSAGEAIIESAAKMIIQSNNGDVDVTAGSGAIDLVAANSSEFLVTGAAQSLTLESQSGSLELKADTGAGRFLTLDGKLNMAKDVGFGVGSTAGEALLVGQVVYASSPTAVSKAARTSADCPIGLVMEGGAGIGDDTFVHTVHGARANTATNAVNADVGKFLYLDAAGAMTMTPPVASGDYVWRLGCIVGINGANAVILWAPQFIAKRP